MQVFVHQSGSLTFVVVCPRGFHFFSANKAPIKNRSLVLFQCFSRKSPLHIGIPPARAFIHPGYSAFTEKRVGRDSGPEPNALKGRCSTIELPTRSRLASAREEKLPIRLPARLSATKRRLRNTGRRWDLIHGACAGETIGRVLILRTTLFFGFQRFEFVPPRGG